MQTNQIIDITTPVVKATNRELIVLHLDNNKSLVRDRKQFELDVRNSLSSSVSMDELGDLIGGTVSGDYQWNEAGSTYIADATSSIVKSGKANIGDTIERTESGYRVEGFLKLKASASASQEVRIAAAIARTSTVASKPQPVDNSAQMAELIAKAVAEATAKAATNNKSKKSTTKVG
jgi:hypothetical protein